MQNLWPPGGVKFDPRAIIWRNLIETHKVKLHAKFCSSMPYGFLQEDFQRFQFLSFVAIATRVFERIKFFQEILKRTMAGTFLWNFIKIRWGIWEEKKMFKEKVNTQTDRHMTDNGPWHKLAGIQPVELKNLTISKGKVAILIWKICIC